MFKRPFQQCRRLICSSRPMPKRKTKEDKVTYTGPIIEHDGSILIKILAKPGAKHNSITDFGEEEVGIQIAAPPVDGEANTELVKFLSKLLGVKKSQLSLDKGSRSRNKTVSVTGTTKDLIVSQLKTAVND